MNLGADAQGDDAGRQLIGLSEGNILIMGRDANFSELREAIRQGQAKIAQGLKTGQMRSDRDKGNRVQLPRLDPARELLGKKPILTDKSALFEKPKKKAFRFRFPALPQIRMPRLPRVPLPGIRPVLYGMGAVLGIALVVFVFFWIGKALMGLATSPSSGPDVGSKQTASAPPSGERNETPAGTQSPVPVPQSPQETTKPPAEPVRQAPVEALPRTGDNVIVIQGITSSRESELKSVQDFFAKNGIPTDLIRRNNYSLLVTRQMFDNPERSGTTGYAMKQKIKLLGKNYPAQTGDAKFGTEPFQDAYGMVLK